MQQEKNTSGRTGSPEKKEHSQPGVPLSANIPNAHASGDGALERDKESLLKPDDEKNSRNDDAIEKAPESY